jgi:hypothetical protein
MENGNGNKTSYRDFPQWVRVLMQVGFPIFVALYFMGVFEPLIPNIWSKHVLASEAHYQQQLSIMQKLDDQTKLLRLICRNGAPDITSRLECDR